MFEAIRSLSPKQRFLGFVIVVLISAVTSLGTAYMSGSDCTEVSEKYTKSVENYNKLIEITDDTQKKYLKAKEDIIVIQDKLVEIYGILGKTHTTTKSSSSVHTQGGIGHSGHVKDNLENSTKNEDTIRIMTSQPEEEAYYPKKYLKVKKVVVTKTESPKEAFGMIDSLIKITKKYEKKK